MVAATAKHTASQRASIPEWMGETPAMHQLPVVGESWAGPIGAYPHHGVWRRPNWEFADLPVERFVELARGWRSAGATMIGGCCGIGSGHIGALRTDLA